MALASTAYRSYLFDKIGYKGQMIFPPQVDTTNFVERVKQLLHEYKLAEQIQAAQAGQRSKVKILDAGCGDASYLRELERELRAQGLLDGVEMHQIVNNRIVATTSEISRAGSTDQLGEPASAPGFFDTLKDSPELAEFKFDFIYAAAPLIFLPRAWQNLEKLYQMLEAGGVIFLRDLLLRDFATKDRQPAPRFSSLGLTEQPDVANEGHAVPLKYADWLQKTGAISVQTIPDGSISGENTQTRLANLRGLVVILHETKPLLVASGAATETEIEESLAILQREIWLSTTNYVNILARKPVATTALVELKAS